MSDNPAGTATHAITPELIQDVVARYYFITTDELCGNSRPWHISRPRQIAMYLTRLLRPDLSYPKIAQAFGGKDHSTAHTACKKTAKRIAADPNLSSTVTRLKRQILASTPASQTTV